jgi:hypothetical protein
MSPNIPIRLEFGYWGLIFVGNPSNHINAFIP